MKSAIISSTFFLTLVSARPVNLLQAIVKREVPQEHSHNLQLSQVRDALNLNNPDGIQDPVFGLLGNAAAAAGAGKITDLDCLQQATADQAFTNSKAAIDVTGMTAALIYRALERNTGKVGLQSVSCTAVKAVNPEIAAISQHQDPASTGAAAANKAIVLELAKQIASIGGDPQDALKSGTFKAGDPADSTAKGNSCDTADDTAGCIFSQNLIVDDATADEIASAAGGASSGASASGSTAAPAASNSTGDAAACAADPAASADPSASADPAASASTAPAAAASGNSTASTGAVDLGSCTDPAIAFGVGFDGRKEASFQPDDTTTFTHGSALNPGIIAQFICDRLNDQCKASASTVATCRTAQTAINGKNGDPAAADDFNKALGVTATKLGVDSAAAAAPAAGVSSSSSSSSSAPAAAASSSSSTTGAANADFGTCTDPSIKFAAGLDGRKENAFAPVNTKDFNHGSALNIGVIADFICGQLQSKCKAGADVVSRCQSASVKAKGLSGQAAADGFNEGVGA